MVRHRMLPTYKGFPSSACLSISQESAYIDARVSCLYKVNPNSNKTQSPTHNLALVYRLWSSGTFLDIIESSLYVFAHQSNPAHPPWLVFYSPPHGGSYFPPLGIPGYLSPTVAPRMI